jgi:uncharacterized membrane protein
MKRRHIIAISVAASIGWIAGLVYVPRITLVLAAINAVVLVALVAAAKWDDRRKSRDDTIWF